MARAGGDGPDKSNWRKLNGAWAWSFPPCHGQRRPAIHASLMLVTALAPVIGYDKASQIAHHAADHDLTLKEAALKLGFVTEAEFDRIVDPAKMVKPYVATES
ncbi:MAG: hypothetical protein ACJ8AW_15965 [Rhodopila sp.]